MASKPIHYPGLASIPRLTTLFASLFVSLGSGTNYVYSAYSPQLGSRLGITHTQLNIIGLAGNVGVYGSGPVWGRIVDLRGPRILLVCAFLFLLSGYSGIRFVYDSGITAPSSTVPTLTLCLLILCSFMTGAGGNGGLTSALNSTAKTFPDKARATALGIVISGFGLSAFLFSTISRIEFSGNTSSFLRLLAFGTSIPMIFGFFLVRPIPLPPAGSQGNAEHGRPNVQNSDMDLGARDGEDSALLSSDASVPEAPVQLSRRAALSRGLLPNVYGKKLWTSTDFWLLFAILSMLSGTGLTFINNVGSMSQALYLKSAINGYNPIEAAQWQATQVSSISITNFAGRIFIGLVADYSKNRLGLPRSWCLILPATFFFISQVMAANIDDIHHLWMASAMLGLAHGSIFSLCPSVTLDWFGLPHFSENWGYLCASPVIAGNIFSIVFGRNLDAHEMTDSAEISTTQCLLGRKCYADALYLTMSACFLSILLSIWAGWRDRKKLEMASRANRLDNSSAEVIWEHH